MCEEMIDFCKRKKDFYRYLEIHHPCIKNFYDNITL